jgi:1,4-alpha-glucan branching enzyme
LSDAGGFKCEDAGAAKNQFLSSFVYTRQKMYKVEYKKLMNIHDALAEGLLLEKGFVDPHHFLGLQKTERGQSLIRLWRPGAQKCHLEVCGQIVEAKAVHPAGLFEWVSDNSLSLSDYRVYYSNGLLAHDPYAFMPTLGSWDHYFLGQGVHYELYHALGARVITHQGVEGTKFVVWAPNARSVSLIADFNFWDGRAHPMRSLGFSGLWEIFVPEVKEGEKYKFEIHTKSGERKVKADPLAFYTEMRPSTASIVFNTKTFKWTDAKWMEERGRFREGSSPMVIYEVHLGSWRKEEWRFLSYRQLAPLLADYCKEMGFTHVELMGVCEHPLDESWGYQVTGYFSATSRFGSPADFQYFVNHLHEKGIGVLMDWVPAHFPMDEHGLAQFDGTFLYEHADERQRIHPHWNTYIFNYGRHEVSNFLIASALFWLDQMHIDGLRVDAVASMLYLDYGRREGQWIPNAYGTNFNLEAIEFLKHFNSIIHQKFPTVLTIAEESTAFGGVTRSPEQGGLGFDYKWNMGWMNDTLTYFSTDPIYRFHTQGLLTFVMIYIYSERFVCVLSHDEVVHGKASLMGKMPGDDWQKFAGMRLLYSYMLGTPGKKLLFMGAEFGQWHEWSCLIEIDWSLCQFERHQHLQACIRDLNHLYLAHSAFWQWDFESRGFEWVNFSDSTNSVLSYLRKSEKETLLVVHHFTPSFLPEYRIYLREVRQIREIFNTDRKEYGGSGKINEAISLSGNCVTILLPPLATLVFEVIS